MSSLASTVASLTTQVYQLNNTFAALVAGVTHTQGGFNGNSCESLYTELYELEERKE